MTYTNKMILNRLRAIKSEMNQLPFSDAKAMSARGLKEFDEVIAALEEMVFGI